VQKQLVLLGLLALTLIVKSLTLVWFILVIIIIKPFFFSHVVFYQLPTGEMSNSNYCVFKALRFESVFLMRNLWNLLLNSVA
jgi:hypothetical protein